MEKKKTDRKKLHIDERYYAVNLTLSIIIYSVVVPFCVYLCVDNYIHGNMLVAKYAAFCLGNDRLLELMVGAEGLNAEDVIHRLQKAVEKHRDGASPNDDLTLLCVRVLAPKEN